MAKEVESKIRLLLSPQQLLSELSILQRLKIRKAVSDVPYETIDLDFREINSSFLQLPKMAKDILGCFSPNYIDARKTDIRSRYKLGRSGMQYKEFYQAALLRELHGSFEKLKPFAALFKWYHKIWNDKSNAKIAPCTFSSYKPQLQFDVVKDKDLLVLNTHITLNGTAYDISDFKRYHFLLDGGNEYFLLGFKDFQTLEWLHESRPGQYGHNPTELVQNILRKLEEDYPVNRNGLFSQNIIDSAPVNRVMLSEISSQFLVFTPQWVYEGFIVEGPWKETSEITRAGEAYVIKRNKEHEALFTKLLVGLHPNFVKQLNGWYYVSFQEAQKKQWFLKTYHFLLENDIQVVGMDMLQHFRYSNDKAVTDVQIKENENNTLTIKFSLYFGKEEISLTELQKLVLSGQRAILLKDGSLGILDDDWIQQYSAIIKHGKISKNEIVVAKGMAVTEEKSPDNAPGAKTYAKKRLVESMAAMATARYYILRRSRGC